MQLRKYLPTGLSLRVFTLIFIALSVYMVIPLSGFPPPLPDSPQSQEPRDVENIEELRAYFTNSSREEIMSHYRQAFRPAGFFSSLPSLQLNYPPEEAEWYVYSPIKASYMEETAYPLRESIFISAYIPGEKEDQIAFQGQPYETKVTIRYYQSPLWARLLIAALSTVFLYLVYNLTCQITKSIIPRRSK